MREIFEDDPEKERQVRLKYLIGLAHMGLDQLSEAKRAFEEALALDPNHMEAQMELRWLAAGRKNKDLYQQATKP